MKLMKSLKLLIASAILLPGIASPPDVFSKDAAASLEATYSLRDKNKDAGQVATMTIFDQKGTFFRIKGDKWDGMERIEGAKGRYDWEFSNGRSGRTTFTVQGDACLI